MKRESPPSGKHEKNWGKEEEKKTTWKKARQDARALYEQINQELDRIDKMPDGQKLCDRLWNEIFSPPQWSRETLIKCAVYHVMIGSTTNYEDTPQIDLPGDQNLMSFYQQKLKELQQI